MRIQRCEKACHISGNDGPSFPTLYQGGCLISPPISQHHISHTLLDLVRFIKETIFINYVTVSYCPNLSWAPVAFQHLRTDIFQAHNPPLQFSERCRSSDGRHGWLENCLPHCSIRITAVHSLDFNFTRGSDHSQSCPLCLAIVTHTLWLRIIIFHFCP